jgi:hypothetical protein
MRIKHLSITNFKGVRRVEVHGTDIVEIAGENGSGKTSVLDAAVAALAGKRNIDVQPLSLGATRGEVLVDLGDLLVKRTFTERGGGTLTVTQADGAKLGQRHLDTLLGEFTFDPLAFSALPGPQQAAVLRGLAGPDWNTALAELDRDIDLLEEQRRGLGRDIKRFGALPNIESVEPVDVAELLAMQEGIQAHNRDQAARRADRSRTCELLVTADAELVRLRQALAEAEARKLRLDDALAALPQLERALPTEHIREALATAAENNARALAYEANEARRAELRQAEKEHAAAERKLQTLREQRAQHLRTAPLPLPGLDWGPEGVTVDGVPMAQVNFTKRLLLGTAIGHAVSGALKICMIREHGGSIVGASWDALLEWCRAHKVQLWVETAGKGHTAEALVITEGRLESYDPADEEI